MRSAITTAADVAAENIMVSVGRGYRLRRSGQVARCC